MNPTFREKVFLIINLDGIRTVCNIQAIEICADDIRNDAYYVLHYRTDESSRQSSVLQGSSVTIG